MGACLSLHKRAPLYRPTSLQKFSAERWLNLYVKPENMSLGGLCCFACLRTNPSSLSHPVFACSGGRAATAVAVAAAVVGHRTQRRWDSFAAS